MSAAGWALDLSNGASSWRRVAANTSLFSNAAANAGTGTKSRCGSKRRFAVRRAGWSFSDASSCELTIQIVKGETEAKMLNIAMVRPCTTFLTADMKVKLEGARVCAENAVDVTLGTIFIGSFLFFLL